MIVVGVHTPEFERERDVDNVKAAIRKLQIDYPVAIDNDDAIWDGFKNKYWPALYLVDETGTIVLRHVGELHRDTEAWNELIDAIESRLKEKTRPSR